MPRLLQVPCLLTVWMSLGMVSPWNQGPTAWAADDEIPEKIEFFESKIRPLFVEKCGECHMEGKAKGGFSLDSSEIARKGGDSGPAYVPGQADGGLLLEVLAHTGDIKMPPAGKLSDEQLGDVKKWLLLGAPWPANKEGGEAAGAVGFQITPEQRAFWSFQPIPAQVIPPAVKTPDWSRGPIDQFVLAEMESRGLVPSPRSDKLTFLRRASFDLTGLPPTKSEIDAFLADSSAEAYANVVDRLLMSPQYGERWGRHWLDVARYAEDQAHTFAARNYPQGFRYRDWVVRALNEDLGYDEFLERQLAADLRPDLPVTELAALGFLGLSPSYWKELKLSPAVIETVVADEWEERITALTGTVLGLTVACARCHDHKQDPISQEDYYAVAGMLASTRLRPRPLLSEGETRLVRSVRDQLAELARERDRQQAIKPPTVESQAAVDELNARIAALEGATPQLAAPLVYGVEEAHIAVLPDGPDRTQVVYRDGQAIDVAVQVRGNPAQRGRVVPRGFPQVLDVAAQGRGDADQESAEGRPEQPTRGAEVGEQRVDAHRGGFREGSGRLEWARRCRTTAAPLVSRVFVNRVWKQHFGVGLVETPSNFGAGGELPSHPELLDDLAQGFVASGWSVKWLQRQIVLSAAYRQASTRNDVGVRQDPGNRLLWRSSRRRLDIEGWRDSLLLAAGRLSRQVGGPDRPLDDSAHNRRTVYGTVRRRDLAAVLRLFDAPDATQHVSHRESTITPLQTLFAFNSPLMQDTATEFARRIVAVAPSDPVAQLQWAWREAYQREPTEAEQRAVVEFLQQSGSDQVLARWQELAQVVLMSNEFTFVD